MAIFDSETINELLFIHEIKHSRVPDTTESQLIRFYQHCVKWVHQQNRQYFRWINTIIDSSRELKKLYDGNNKFASIKLDLYNCYLKGVEKAKAETKLNIQDDDYVYSVFSDFEPSNDPRKQDVIGILNEEGIKEWLIMFAYNDDIVRLVNGKK